MAGKAVTDFRVIRNNKLASNLYLLVLEGSDALLPVAPGQFVNVEIPGNKEVFLRRPFSVFHVDHGQNSLSLLVKILGKGSLSLSKVRPGDQLSLVYPLGKGFTLPLQGENVLAVGGGSGIAPLLFLSAKSGLPPDHFTLLMGARSKSDHISAGEFTAFAGCFFATEDGSWGEKGLVTHHSLFNDLSGFDRIYTCGPLPMMKAVAREASRQNLFCEVSLENLMACGFGVCLCCIEPTVKGNVCVCTEGPVFNIKNLKW